MTLLALVNMLTTLKSCFLVLTKLADFGPKLVRQFASRSVASLFLSALTIRSSWSESLVLLISQLLGFDELKSPFSTQATI